MCIIVAVSGLLSITTMEDTFSSTIYQVNSERQRLNSLSGKQQWINTNSGLSGFIHLFKISPLIFKNIRYLIKELLTMTN